LALPSQIVAREKVHRRWGSHVTANYVMARWSRLVDESKDETYPEHMVVEEYANDLRTTSESADRSRADACFARAEQAQEANDADPAESRCENHATYAQAHSGAERRRAGERAYNACWPHARVPVSAVRSSS
jgi:hypothetical protein